MKLYDELAIHRPYELPDAIKTIKFKRALSESYRHHIAHCSLYHRFCEKKGFSIHNDFELSDFPYIPVNIFKKINLMSIPGEHAVKILRSSATSGNTSSKIYIDKTTQKRQVTSLVSLLNSYLGQQRQPFLIMDVDPNQSQNLSLELSARSAAVRGFLIAASSAEYGMTLNKGQPKVNTEQIIKTLNKHQKDNIPLIIFGYTYVLHESICKALRELKQEFKLNNAIVFHIGGWKKLQQKAVTRDTFNQNIESLFGIPPERIYDIYGFSEQLGLLYIDHASEVKCCPATSEIIIRCPKTLKPLPDGEVGLVEMITPMPTSYPGIAVLLDDLGVITSRQPSKNGRHGTKFKILGRVPTTTAVRGCGDVLAEVLS